MSYVLEELAPDFGFAFWPAITQVFDDEAPLFGFNSLPSQIHVFDEEAPVLGLISLPSKSQVLEDEAPLFGFSSLPSQTQSRGKAISFGIHIPLVEVHQINGHSANLSTAPHTMSHFDMLSLTQGAGSIIDIATRKILTHCHC